MSELPWAEEAVEQNQQPNHAEHTGHEESDKPGTLSMSADDFSSLEDRILRAVNLVKRERMAREEAEKRAAATAAELAEQTLSIEQLRTEISSLRAERDQVRQRVEKLLSQLDALEL